MIRGLQKTTLIDFPGHVACTVFIGGCNFRCGYCYNKDLVTCPATLAELPIDDFFSFLLKRKGFLEGVCITGGEPTLWTYLVPFIQRIKEEGFKVKLDTNGTNPEKLQFLITRQLIDYVAMDIKASFAQYARVTNTIVPFEKIKESIKLMIQSDIPYEFRTTAVPDVISEGVIHGIGELIKGAERHYLQQFAAHPSAIGETYKTMDALPEKELLRFRDILATYVKTAELRL